MLALHTPVRRRHVVGGAVSGALCASRPARAENVLGSRVNELQTLGSRAQQSTAAEDVPEFWARRLQGQPPPKPRVTISNAPPFVILPGFGNDQMDYTTPLNLPAEVGLAGSLSRRGVKQVSVVPIVRSQWLNVARGLTDPKFVLGDAQPNGPTYNWYLQAAKRTVEDAVAAAPPNSDGRVVLLGHSAGGWLARTLCVYLGDDWTKQNVRGIVTLGSPHASPSSFTPGGTDQTRGLIPNVNRLAPGAFYADRGIFYVTVSSKRVVGDADGTAAERNGYTSYNLILGRAQGVQGDGFVPIEAAFLDGAAQVTMDCYHSGGSADPWPKDNWYGAEQNIDGWLGSVADALSKQAPPPSTQ